MSSISKRFDILDDINIDYIIEFRRFFSLADVLSFYFFNWKRFEIYVTFDLGGRKFISINNKTHNLARTRVSTLSHEIHASLALSPTRAIHFTPTPAPNLVSRSSWTPYFQPFIPAADPSGRSWFKVEPVNQPFTLNRNAYLDLIARAPFATARVVNRTAHLPLVCCTSLHWNVLHVSIYTRGRVEVYRRLINWRYNKYC